MKREMNVELDFGEAELALILADTRSIVPIASPLFALAKVSRETTLLSFEISHAQSLVDRMDN
jgi:hypothetical protein